MAKVYDDPTHGRSSNTTPSGERWPITLRPPADIDYEREVYENQRYGAPSDDEEYIGVIDGRPHRH